MGPYLDASSISHQGQVCIPTHLILESLYEEFRTKFVARVKQLPYGEPGGKNSEVSPLIGHKSSQCILDILQNAVTDGVVGHLQGV